MADRGSLKITEYQLAWTPEYVDVVAGVFITAVLVSNISGKALVEWVERRWWRRRVVALSEIPKSLAFARDVEPRCLRIVRFCGRADAIGRCSR